MAVLEQKINEGDSGFKKTFEAGSEALLMNFVQAAQYQYPEKSAVRELVSNCIDSIREKQMFFEIHSGKAKVSDYYVEQEGELYKDSKYQPEYYDEKWLDKNNNKVKLIYKSNGNIQRDALHIIDNGVGLGGLRLEKHFNPLYSSKRNNKAALGKWGVGSKSGLALQTDYYTIISRYNGMEFHFNVYEYKVEPTVPRFDTIGGTERKYYEMKTSDEELPDGTVRPRRFYYYDTDKPNGVEVILQIKKGLRKNIFDAIKGQFLYLDNIDFEVHEEDGTVRSEPVKAEMEYEDEFFLLASAKSTYYSKPHVVLNGICYGYVDFLQMEEEDRVGNIGLKIDPSKIDVTVNRESVQWTAKTTEAIHKTFKEGEQVAERILNEALVSTDLLDWAFKSAAAVGGGDQNSIIARFANIVDISKSKPKFAPMPKINFSMYPGLFFDGYDVELVIPTVKYSKAQQTNINSLKRERVTNWSTFSGKQIYYQDGETNFRQEMFMLGLYPNGFIKITPTGTDFGRVMVTNEDLKALDSKLTHEEYRALSTEEKDKFHEERRAFFQERRKLADQYIKDSKFTQLYSSVNVPEGFKVNEKQEEEDDAVAEEIINKMSPEERRKLENKIVVTPFVRSDYTSGNSTFWRQKQDVSIKEIITEKDPIVYGFLEDEQNLQLVHRMLLENTKNSWEEGQPKVVMISQANAKYFKHHMFVNDFFMSYNPQSRTISMHNKLVQWQTARKLAAHLPKLRFLSNFGLFDAEAQKVYNEINLYALTHGKDLSKWDDIGTLIEYADRVTELQLYIDEHKGNSEAIAAKSQAIFQTDDFEAAVGIELDIYRKLELLLDHVEPVRELLNHVDVLINTGKEIPYTLEREIKDYLAFKGYLSITNTAHSLTLPENEAETLVA